jgi:FO synthase subunit 1
LRSIAEAAGVPLRERLPVYERYLPADLRSDAFEGVSADPPTGGGEWVSERVQEAIRADDAAGERYRAVLRCDAVAP